MARRRRNPEIIAGRVNADGSIAAGDGFTVQKTGTGTYTVWLLGGFRLIASSACSARGLANAAIDIVPTTVGVGLVVITFSCSTGTAADFAFNFTAVGVQQ